MISGSKVELHRKITELLFTYAGRRYERPKLELKLTSVVSDKQGFLKYINSKRRSRENIGLIFVVDNHLTNWAEEKSGGILCLFFCFDFL